MTDMHASAAKLWSETEEEKLGKVSRKRERERVKCGEGKGSLSVWE